MCVAKWKWSCDFWIHFFVTVLVIAVGRNTTSALPLYLVLVGGRVELPCDLNVSSSEDEVSLILWHKDEASSPVYSVDARDAPLPLAIHFPASEVTNRAYFNSSVTPAVFKLESVKKSQEGIYRCRVEYRRARTETMDMMLKVIIPPREAIITDEYGQRLRGVVGPLNEGQPLSLACEGEGGDPIPTVWWWRGSELLDDSFSLTAQGIARNELLLAKLRRSDLMTTLTCKVANSNLTAPVVSSVTLDMNLVPTHVQITSLYRPLSADIPAEIACIAKGARPPAQVSWWIEKDQVKKGITESSSREDNLTVSTLVIVPRTWDDQKNLTCRADNPQIPTVVLEDVWLFNVHYPPKVEAFLSPDNPVSEGDDVTLTCTITSNPPISELEWLLDGKVIERTRATLAWDYRTSANRTFSLPSVGPQHRGQYQCAGTSSEGKAISDPAALTVHYAPRCRSVRSSVYGVGKTESVSVVCEVDANPQNVTFFWMLNNSIGAKPLSSMQYYSNGTKISIATLSPRFPQDYGVLFCWGRNAMGKQREPCSFRIIPAGPPEKPENCRVFNETRRCVTVQCYGGEDKGLTQLFQLEVYGADSEILLANVTAQKDPLFTLCHLPLGKELIFVLYATNNKGRSKQVVLRSKALLFQGNTGSQNPFGTVGVLVGVIAGIIGVLVLMAVAVVTVTKFNQSRLTKDRDYSPEADKCESHLMKDCKDSSANGNQGPDIIPEKSFFRVEETDFDVSEKGSASVNISKGDIDARKYYEYQAMTLTDDREYLSTPKKLRIIQDLEGEVEDNSITVETPLISSIPLAAQQWADHRKEGLRFSTPV